MLCRLARRAATKRENITLLLGGGAVGAHVVVRQLPGGGERPVAVAWRFGRHGGALGERAHGVVIRAVHAVDVANLEVGSVRGAGDVVPTVGGAAPATARLDRAAEFWHGHTSTLQHSLIVQAAEDDWLVHVGGERTAACAAAAADGHVELRGRRVLQ